MSRIEQPPTNRLIPSYGPPTAGSGLEPAVAPNTPWRWDAVNAQWVSEPVSVSWSAGAVIPSFAAPTAGQLGIVVGTAGTNASDVQASYKPFGGVTTTLGITDGTTADRGPSSAATATDAGAGTAYLVWNMGVEAQLPDTAYTATNADVLPAETRTIDDILGTDFTITPATWTEEQIGNPGDWAVDLSSYTGDVWGPRDVGGWGGGPEFQLGGVLTSPDGTLHRLIVANDGTLSTEAI